MVRIALIGLLAAGAWGCEEFSFNDSPPTTTPDGRAAMHVESESSPKPAEPPEEKYPGGEVRRVGRKVISVGHGRATGTSPQQKLMARRAAYLIAVRNAGLYLSGLRAGEDGRLLPTKDGAIRASLTVRDFRETASIFDEKTRTATVTIEITIPKD